MSLSTCWPLGRTCRATDTTRSSQWRAPQAADISGLIADIALELWDCSAYRWTETRCCQVTDCSVSPTGGGYRSGPPNVSILT